MFHASRTALFVIVVGILVAVVTLAPVQRDTRHQHHRNNNNNNNRNNNNNNQHRYDIVLPASESAIRLHGAETVADDGTARSERSTNLSHITGTARKIQMYIKNKHLQILPDGTINGTGDDGSDYTIFQRPSVNNGQLKIQGVASCLFLCMDSCGLLYGSREFTEDCVFNEMIEQHHYNTYSSARHSNTKRTLYLALNNRGQPRKMQLRGAKTLGKMSTYARVLTQPVSAERVDDMVARILSERQGVRRTEANPIRHHGYHLLCPQVVGHELGEDADGGRDKFRCRTRKKRKKKKRRCNEGEEEGECERDEDGEEDVHKECDEDEKTCPNRTETPEKKNKPNKKCEDGEVGCKRKGKGKEKDKESEKERTGNNKCEGSGCQRKGVDVMSRRRCEKGEADEECKKRLQESRRRRRARIRDRTEKETKQAPDENAKKRKKFTSGKNKKKFVGDGEISKDLDSGRRLAAMLEVATNLNTPADPVTVATSSKRSPPGGVADFSRNPTSRVTSVAQSEDIPSSNQRSYPEEDSTPFTDITTPSRLYSLTRPEVTSIAIADVASLAPKIRGNFDDIK